MNPCFGALRARQKAFRRWQKRVGVKWEEMGVGGREGEQWQQLGLKHHGLSLPAQPFLAQLSLYLINLYNLAPSFPTLSGRLSSIVSLFHLPLFSRALRDVHPGTRAPLIYAGLHRANRSLTFCLTVQRVPFPKGSIKIWYSVSQGKRRAGLQSGLVNQ